MTCVKRANLQKQILEIVQNESLANLFYQVDFSCCSVAFENGEVSGTIGFSISQISLYLYKKMGYWVRKDIIRHALNPLKRGNLFYKTS